MKKTLVSLVAAIGEDRAMGIQGKIPWLIHEDNRHFRRLTKGHVIIMGRKTAESIGKLLAGRINIIVTKDKNFQVEGSIIANSIEVALKKALEIEKEEIFICGGGSVYSQTIDLADKLYLTVIKGDFEADVFFPEYAQFTKIVSEKKSSEGDYEYTFLELEK